MATETTASTPPQTQSPQRAITRRAVRTIAPRVDIYETDAMYVLLADMPGVTTEGLEVIAERDSLTIHGRADLPDDASDYQEFELGEYHRTFTLTEDLETDGVTATLRDGVLTVQIPKSPRVQPKKISVRSE